MQLVLFASHQAAPAICLLRYARTYCCYSVPFGKQLAICDLLPAAAIYFGCAMSEPGFEILTGCEHAPTDGMTTCQPTL